MKYMAREVLAQDLVGTTPTIDTRLTSLRQPLTTWVSEALIALQDRDTIKGKAWRHLVTDGETDFRHTVEEARKRYASGALFYSVKTGMVPELGEVPPARAAADAPPAEEMEPDILEDEEFCLFGDPEDGVIDVAEVAEMEEVPEVVEMEEVPSASASAGEKRLRSLERPCGQVPAEKGTELSAIGGIRLVEEAAASRDAVMPPPGGTRPAALLEIRLCRPFWALCLFVSSCLGFLRKPEDIIPEEWTRLSGRKNSHQHVDPRSGVRHLPSEQVGSLLLCVLQSATFGAGAAGGQFCGPAPPLPTGYIFIISRMNYSFCVWNFKLFITELPVTGYRFLCSWNYQGNIFRDHCTSAITNMRFASNCILCHVGRRSSRDKTGSQGKKHRTFQEEEGFDFRKTAVRHLVSAELRRFSPDSVIVHPLACVVGLVFPSKICRRLATCANR